MAVATADWVTVAGEVPAVAMTPNRNFGEMARLRSLQRMAHMVPSLNSFAEIPWLQPYPDRLLDEVAPTDVEPDAVVVARETIELAYLTVIQLLPPRQRAVLILRDVLDYSAAETAAALDSTVASVNSALQRAKATLRQGLPARRLDWSPAKPSEGERALLARFIDAHERADAAAAIAIAHEDIRITMPPHPMRFFGVEEMLPLLQEVSKSGEWRLVPSRANRHPAAASYLREWGGSEFKAFKIDVLRVAGDTVTEITTFGAELFPEFGLPSVLEVRER